jgi:hypothetical protein
MADRIVPTDPVEAEMGTGTVLRRDKVVSRKLALICLAMFIGFLATSIGYMRGWGAERSAFTHWLTYLLVPFVAWIGLTKTVLRTVVTTSEIHVSHGFRGTHIPIASITKCLVFEGERAPRGTEVFSPAGLRGMWVEWTGAGGIDRMTMIGSEDPVALVASVEEARRALGARARIGDGPQPVVETSPASDEVSADEVEDEVNRVRRL